MTQQKELIIIPEGVSALDKDSIEQSKSALSNYITKDIISDFIKIPSWAKLMVCQKIHPSLIKRRVISGSTTAPYIPHQIAKKYLNFCFGFDISNKILSSDIEESMQGDKKVYIASATVQFRFGRGDGTYIERDVVAGWKMYENPATNKNDALKAAVSRSWAVVAETFGIGSHLAEDESRAFKRVKKSEKKTVEATVVEPEKPSKPKMKKRVWSK